MSLRIIEPISLTNSFKMPAVKAAWSAYLPQTKRYVIEINRSLHSKLLVPATGWEIEHKKYGCVGTAYDYAVGSLLFKTSLVSPLRRAKSAIGNRPELWIIYELNKLLSTELASVRAGKKSERHLDFFRGLGLLAELDAMFRNSMVPMPSWFASTQIRGISDLRRALRSHYPKEFVEELQLLLKVTKEDFSKAGLLKAKPVEYNPTFGSLMIKADGDLLLGDILFDLKLSTKGFGSRHLWQLLGYAALDVNLGNHRVRRVGLYNPRYRALWIKPVDDLIHELNRKSFKQFCHWFNSTLDQIFTETRTLVL